MKRLDRNFWKGLAVFAVIVVIALLIPGAARAASPLDVQLDAMIAQHPDVPCPDAPQPGETIACQAAYAAGVPELAAFAKTNGLDPAKVYTAFNAWIFQRGQVSSYKLTPLDFIALHYADVNGFLAALAAQPAWQLDDNGQPLHGRWIRWLNRFDRGG